MTAKGIPLENVDIVMARGGLITPVVTGVYFVNQDMRDVLNSSVRENMPATSAPSSPTIAKKSTKAVARKGFNPATGHCGLYRRPSDGG